MAWSKIVGFDAGQRLNLRGSREQARSAPYNTPSPTRVVCGGPGPPRRFETAVQVARGPGARCSAPGRSADGTGAIPRRAAPRPPGRPGAYRRSARGRGGARAVAAVGADSGLEAFSRDPADGGLPPPALRPGGIAGRNLGFSRGHIVVSGPSV